MEGIAENTLIVILGPTASGKTEVAVGLAEWLSTEIISADSRQFFREMSIGTARPDPDTLARAKHHFIGHISVTEPYDIARFEKDSLDLLAKLFRHKNQVIMAGGSGLYIDSVVKGLDVMPGRDDNVRAAIMSGYDEHGIDYIRDELQRVDPVYYAKVDKSNPVRMIRAIEVCLATGKPYSSFRKGNTGPRPFRTIKIGLELPREELIRRIDSRIAMMIKNGLLDEVISLLPFRHLNALNTVGYRELFEFLDGKITMEEALEKIRVNTRRFAKRQMTWFRKDKEIEWFHPRDTGRIQSYIEERSGLVQVKP